MAQIIFSAGCTHMDVSFAVPNIAAHTYIYYTWKLSPNRMQFLLATNTPKTPSAGIYRQQETVDDVILIYLQAVIF